MKKALSILLCAALLSSAVACAFPRDSVSESASNVAKYEEYLTSRGIDTSGFIISKDAKSKSYGVDLSSFDDDGYFISADSGDVVILAKSDAGLDRAVRQYAKYGNSNDYFFVYGDSPRVKSLTVCGADISTFAVVRDDDDHEVSDWEKNRAAEELVKYIEKACGVKLASYTKSEYDALADKPAHMIFVHHVYPDLGDEDFTVEVTDDGNVNVLGGRFRGCLFGAYELLREIGWRFVTDSVSHSTVEYLYEADNVDLTPAINHTVRPAIPSRAFWDDIFPNNTNDIADKLAVSGNCHSTYGVYGSACHGLQNSRCLEKGEVYEGIDAVGHQPCFTDPDIIQCAVDWALAECAHRIASGQEIGKDFCNIDVAQYDHSVFCDCKNCRAAIKYDGAQSGPVLTFTNAVAEAIADDYPGVSVLMLAYSGTNAPPKKTVPLDNVRISYCVYVGPGMITCSHHCIDGSDSENCDNVPFAKELNGWKALCTNRNLDVWYYPFNCYGGWAFQAPVFHTIYRDVQYLVNEIEISSIFYHANTETGVLLHGLVTYLGSQLCLRGDLTEDEYWELIKEWFDIVYGDAGYYLYEYFIQNEESAIGTGCWCAFHSASTRKVDNQYHIDHFDGWWDLFNEAIGMADTAAEEKKVRLYEAGMLYMCLGLTHESRYLNGDAESRAEYEKRYTELYKTYRENGLWVYNDFIVHTEAPEVLDFNVSPFNWHEGWYE